MFNPLGRYSWIKNNLFEPYKHQTSVLVHPSKKKIVNFQRRAGTTKLLAAIVIHEINTNDNASVLWCCPNRQNFEVANDYFYKLSPRLLQKMKRNVITCCTDRTDFFGKRPTLVIVDGMTYMNEMSFCDLTFLPRWKTTECLIATTTNLIDGWPVFYG